MTFLDIQTKALLRVDETIGEAETEVIGVIKDAINNGYMLLASLVDKRTATTTLALDDYNNKLPLPDDFIDLVMAEHETLGEISPTDYNKTGDLLHFKSRDLTSGDVILTYINYPAKLVNDGDVLRLKDAYLGALTAYAAYVYQLYKKKYSACELLLREFNQYIPSNNVQVPQQTQ
jgi:hypothetical protein